MVIFIIQQSAIILAFTPPINSTWSLVSLLIIVLEWYDLGLGHCEEESDWGDNLVKFYETNNNSINNNESTETAEPLQFRSVIVLHMQAATIILDFITDVTISYKAGNAILSVIWIKSFNSLYI